MYTEWKKKTIKAPNQYVSDEHLVSYKLHEVVQVPPPQMKTLIASRESGNVIIP